MVNFIKNKKNIILSSSILNGINTFSTFCADENKKNIEIVIIYNGNVYKASDIEVTRDNFAEPEQRIEFIKNNKDKFVCGFNKLNFKDSIIEQSIKGKFDGGYTNEAGENEFILPSHDDLGRCFDNLLIATITVEDSVSLKYIKTDNKLKIKDLEESIENVINYKNSFDKYIDKDGIIGNLKAVIKAKCKIVVNDDIFIFDKNADEDGIIKESCTLKINFPNELLEGAPKPPEEDEQNNNNNNNNNNSNNSNNNDKKKSYCGS